MIVKAGHTGMANTLLMCTQVLLPGCEKLRGTPPLSWGPVLPLLGGIPRYLFASRLLGVCLGVTFLWTRSMEHFNSKWMYFFNMMKAYSQDEQQKFFAFNAKRFYCLD